jgi:SAM-dependent methyltransferase
MIPPCIVCASSESTRSSGLGRFEVRACTGCGLRFLAPQPTAAELEALYGESYFARSRPGAPGYDTYLEEIDHLRSTFDHRLGLLPQPGPGDILMDVGAAVGVFVQQARQRGWDARGVEPSAWAAEHARTDLDQPVETGTLRSLALPDASLAGVTLWEVIEHLPDPGSELAEIRRVLRPGGFLALSTPDAGSLVARGLGRRWPGWRKIPEHLYFFDRPSLVGLLGHAGFRVEQACYVPLFVSLGYLLDRAREVTGIGLGGMLTERMRRRPVRVNPFFDLFILARAT